MKIIYANTNIGTNNFDKYIAEGLAAKGHLVFHARPNMPAGEIRAAIDQADVCLSAWADQTLVALSTGMKPKRLVTYLRSYEAFTPQLIQAIAWNQVDAVIYVAEHVRRYAREAWPVLREIPDSVVHNGIPKGLYTTEKDDGFDRRVCFLGNLSHKKGIGLLMQAVSALAAHGYTVDIWGEWQEERFEQYARRWPRANFMGKAEVGPDFFKPYGYVLSTSPWEGCPWNIIEARQAGCAPLVHDWPGAQELFGETWLELYDLYNLAEACRIQLPKLSSVPEPQRFDAETMVDGIEESLLQACARRRATWVVPGDINHAGSRLRGHWPIDQVRQIGGLRVCKVDPHTPMPPRAEVYVVSRAWGQSVDTKIDTWHGQGAAVVYDACDLYPEAVPTINGCDLLVVNSDERARQYRDAGVIIDITMIPDPHDPAPFLPVHKKPLWTVAYHGTGSTLVQLEGIGELPPDVVGVVYAPPGTEGSPYNGWFHHDWKLDTIHRELNQQGVGVLPVGACENDAGKSANKLLTNLVAGLPTLCGDLPAYRALLEAAGHGEWLVESGADWSEAIQTALDQGQDQREAMVNDCRKVMQLMFGPAVVGRMWSETLGAVKPRWSKLAEKGVK